MINRQKRNTKKHIREQSLIYKDKKLYFCFPQECVYVPYVITNSYISGFKELFLWITERNHWFCSKTLINFAFRIQYGYYFVQYLIFLTYHCCTKWQLDIGSIKNISGETVTNIQAFTLNTTKLNKIQKLKTGKACSTNFNSEVPHFEVWILSIP